jgi:hypothetical protein
MRSDRNGNTSKENPANFSRSDIPFRFLGFFGFQTLQIDLQFAVLDSPGVLAEFGTARLLGHAENRFVFVQLTANGRARSQRLRQRGARDAAHVDDEVILAQLWQELTAEPRQRPASGHKQQPHHHDEQR